LCSFASGFFYFYLVENNLMHVAEFLVKRLGKQLRIKNRFT
jgi:hypothetical protein